MRALLALVLISLLVLPAAADSRTGDPNTPRDPDARKLGEMFCAARISGDMSPMLPYIDPSLRKVSLMAIGEYLWQGHSGSRPKSCTIEIVNGFDRTAEVLVRIWYTAPRDNWADTLNLLRTPTGWVITNLFYEDGGNLRFRLFEGGYISFFG
jgi:hypothetical protein